MCFKDNLHLEQHFFRCFNCCNYNMCLTCYGTLELKNKVSDFVKQEDQRNIVRQMKQKKLKSDYVVDSVKILDKDKFKKSNKKKLDRRFK